MNASQLPLSGAKLGRYQLVSRLAIGGMAEVWLARATGIKGFQKTIVIKTILPHLADDPEFLNMFINEALLASTLNHPNIVQIFDFGEIDENYYIAMEFIVGRSLRQVQRKLRKKRRAIPSWLVLRVAMGVCEALDYAHNRQDEKGGLLGIVHRDVTPDNIMVTFSGVPKVVDFGIAKASTGALVTQAGKVKGKLSYLAPEQIVGAGTAGADWRTDIYALGVILYELLTGSRPFRAENDIALLYKIPKEKPRPPSEVAHWISTAISDIVMKALAKNPDDRYQSAREFGEEIERFLGSTGQIPTERQISEYMCKLFDEDQRRTIAEHGVATSSSETSGAGSAGSVGSVDGPDSLGNLTVSAPVDEIDIDLEEMEVEFELEKAAVVPDAEEVSQNEQSGIKRTIPRQRKQSVPPPIPPEAGFTSDAEEVSQNNQSEFKRRDRRLRMPSIPPPIPLADSPKPAKGRNPQASSKGSISFHEAILNELDFHVPTLEELGEVPLVVEEYAAVPPNPQVANKGNSQLTSADTEQRPLIQSDDEATIATVEARSEPEDVVDDDDAQPEPEPDGLSSVLFSDADVPLLAVDTPMEIDTPNLAEIDVPVQPVEVSTVEVPSVEVPSVEVSTVEVPSVIKGPPAETPAKEANAEPSSTSIPSTSMWNRLIQRSHSEFSAEYQTRSAEADDLELTDKNTQRRHAWDALLEQVHDDDDDDDESGNTEPLGESVPDEGQDERASSSDPRDDAPDPASGHMWDAFINRSRTEDRDEEDEKQEVGRRGAPSQKGSIVDWSGISRHNPESEAAVLFEDGLVLVREGRKKEAMKLWERTVELCPDTRRYQSNLRRLRESLEGKS